MMVAEHSWPAVCMQKQVGICMLVANSPVKRGGGRAVDWSRDRSEDTEVSAETCPQCG